MKAEYIYSGPPTRIEGAGNVATGDAVRLDDSHPLVQHCPEFFTFSPSEQAVQRARIGAVDSAGVAQLSGPPPVSRISLVEDFVVLPHFDYHEFLRGTVMGSNAFVALWAPNNLGDHPGGVTLCTGDSTTGQANIYGAQAAPYSSRAFVPLPKCTLAEWTHIFSTDPASDNTNDYRILVGPTGDGHLSVGAGLTYRHSENGGRWQAYTNNGAFTPVDTGVDFVQYAWMTYTLRWDGTKLLHFINGQQVAESTLQIPPALVGPCVCIRKQAGNTARNLYLDYVSLYAEVIR